jgi:hypothetical protein
MSMPPPPRQIVIPPDFDQGTIEVIRRVAPFTMTNVERVYSLRQAVRYVVDHQIPGDIVECGVWRGGTMLAAALTLLECGSSDRQLWLYDTFEGMPAPSEHDMDLSGIPASRILQADTTEKQNSHVWAYAPLELVQRVMQSSGYPANRVVFVKGKVEQTIPEHMPSQIALLRLDTDWYESTYHELNHLYPRLAVGGVLIIDDYGHWQGARRAVDQYIGERNLKLLLHRIDYSARTCVKIEA